MSSHSNYKEIYKKLPDQIKLIISSPEFGEIIDVIAESRGLSNKQRNILAPIITKILAGIQDLTNAPSVIEHEVLLDAHIAQTISQDIESKILNNLSNIEYQIRANTLAENIANEVEDIPEDDVLVESKRTDILSQTYMFDKKSYILQWSDLFLINPPQTYDSIEKTKAFQKLHISFSDKINNAKELESILPTYSTDLAKNIKDFILSSVWFTRTKEIASKYSLNDEQTNIFLEIVFLLLIGIEKGDKFKESLIKQMDISSLLAEQIEEDVEERVFEYAFKGFQKNKNYISPSTTRHGSINDTINRDIPPINLPSEIVEEKPDIWSLIEKEPSKNQVSTFEEKLNNLSASSYKPNTEPEVTIVPPEQPSASRINTLEPTPPLTIKNPQSFIATKLTQLTKPEPTEPLEIPKTYNVDPYREPIE